MVKTSFLSRKADTRSVLLVMLLLVAAYSTYSLYVNEIYFIESAIKVGDLQIEIIGYNYTVINDTTSDYQSYLSVIYNLTNPETPNITVSIFTLGAKVYNQYNRYVGANALYLRHELPAGSFLIFNLTIPLTKNITVAVVFTKVTLTIDTRIHVLRLSNLYDVRAIPIYPPEQ